MVVASREWKGRGPMAASAEVTREWLGWNLPLGARRRAGEDSAGVGKGPLWVGLIVLGALATVGLAGHDGPRSVAPRPSAVAAARLPLPLRASLSRVVGAD